MRVNFDLVDLFVSGTAKLFFGAGAGAFGIVAESLLSLQEP
jgi:hypothetical protein